MLFELLAPPLCWYFMERLSPFWASKVVLGAQSKPISIFLDHAETLSLLVTMTEGLPNCDCLLYGGRFRLVFSFVFLTGAG